MTANKRKDTHTNCGHATALFEETCRLIEKSHMATSSVVSNNLREIKDKIQDLNTDVNILSGSLKDHAASEVELHKRIETFITKIDLNDLEGAATIYRDAVGIKRMALGAVVVVSIIGSLGSALIWTMKKFIL